MASQVMRITLKAYDHELVDSSAKKIIETVKKNGSQVSGPVPLPTKKEVVTILRATHKYKDSYILNGTKFQSHNGNCFIRSKLTSHQLFLLRKLISGSEQCFYMFLCQVNVSCGNPDGNYESIAFFFILIDCLNDHSGNQFNIIRFQEYTCFLSNMTDYNHPAVCCADTGQLRWITILIQAGFSLHLYVVLGLRV